MSRSFAVFGAGGAIASALALALNHAAAAPLGQSQALRAAADQISVVLPARTICQITNDYIAGSCEENCARLKDLLTFTYATCAPGSGWPICPKGSTSLVSSDGYHSCCPQERMRVIRSCTAVPSPSGPEFCRIKICGPVIEFVRAKLRSDRNFDTGRYTTPAPRVGPPQPGLLENDGGGFTRQSPAATGRPLGTPQAPGLR